MHKTYQVVIAVISLLFVCAGSRAEGLGTKPPEGAIVLFDGADTSHWRMKDGSDCKWKVVDGALEVTAKAGDIYTKEKLGDCTVHLEFRTPEPGPNDTGEHRGNSGLFLQDIYEIQVLESYGREKLTKGDCGSVYNIKPPDKNVAKKPLEWQSFDIDYKAPRFDADGKKTANARVTVIWNGEKVQDDVEIPHPTRNAKLPEPKEPGPLQLQDHGFAVQYRNIWVIPSKADEVKPSAKPQGKQTVLFDGKDSSQWTMKDGSPCAWPIVDGALVAQKADIITKEKFKDFALHLEFWMPVSPDPNSTNRGKRSNSGVYLQGRYEIQLLDSYGLAPLTYQDCGGIYNQKAPDVNACLPTERWQSMDIVYRAPRYDAQGAKTEKARVSIAQNDTPIQKDIEIDHNSKSGDAEGAEDAPIRLQYHTGPVRFRNIRVTRVP